MDPGNWSLSRHKASVKVTLTNYAQNAIPSLVPWELLDKKGHWRFCFLPEALTFMSTLLLLTSLMSFHTTQHMVLLCWQCPASSKQELGHVYGRATFRTFISWWDIDYYFNSNSNNNNSNNNTNSSWKKLQSGINLCWLENQPQALK